MTAADLIRLLQQHPPTAVVALREGVNAQGDITCEGLRPGFVQQVRMHKLPSSTGWYDPESGAKLYELREDGDDAGAVDGVLLG